MVFRVSVDGEVKFETGPMSDSDPARQVDVPLAGARELRLIATDAGDGIGCDMANWAEARLVRDPRMSAVSATVPSPFGGEPAPPRSAAAGGFSLIAGETGPQVAVMESAGMLTVSVDRGEEVRWTIPVRNVVEPRADHGRRRRCPRRAGRGGTVAGRQATVAHDRQAASQSCLRPSRSTSAASAEIVLTTRGVDDETGVRWSNLRYVVGRPGVSHSARASRQPPRRFRRRSCPTCGRRSSRS